MFRTPIYVHPLEVSINLKDGVYLIGSCFTEEIGDRLRSSKFKALSNPFGTIYNPISIFKVLSQSLDGDKNSGSAMIRHQGIYRHFDFHSDIAATNREEFEKKMEAAYRNSREHLIDASWLIITLGTAIVYRDRESGTIVANCHKIPASRFDREILSAEEITGAFSRFFRVFRKHNKHARIVLTISPVRHIKNSLELNGLSKSILRVAAGSITDNDPEIVYFPSYEIMMDDLRDYRFYKKDLVHPNELAVDYIWEHFSQVFFDRETQKFMYDWEKIKKALSHRPFFPDSGEYAEFLEKIRKKLLSFRDSVDIEEELRSIEKRLHNE